MYIFFDIFVAQLLVGTDFDSIDAHTSSLTVEKYLQQSFEHLVPVILPVQTIDSPIMVLLSLYVQISAHINHS